MGLMRPVRVPRVSSWAAHQRRNPPSIEAGTDFYCPIGTPVYAPETGRVYGYGNSITPDTGRWVGLDLVTGQRFRAMHLSRQALSPVILNNGGFVRKGDILGYSGASGYGEEDWSGNPATGGAHCHVTLWPTQQSLFGYKWVDGQKVPFTVDIMNYIGDDASGGGSSPEPIDPAFIRRKGNNVIRFLYADNGGPQWTVINLSKGTAFRAYTQEDANNLAISVGFTAEVVTAQVLANTLALAAKLAGNSQITYVN